MPAINFKAQFASDVELGIKRQSIRPRGKRVYKVGDKLTLYTGQRTKACRKLGTAIISEVFDIDIVFTDLLNKPLPEPVIRFYVENQNSDRYNDDFLRRHSWRNARASQPSFANRLSRKSFAGVYGRRNPQSYQID